MSIIIRLQNLPWSANSVDIRRFFSGQSIPDGGVHIVGGEMGDAFIIFSTDEDGRLAMAKDGGKIKDMQIKLLLSSRTEMTRVIEQARQQNMVIKPPPQPPTSLQQPTRSQTPTSESDRRRARSPSPHRRSRDRSPARDRRRSPDDRRGSKRDRSRSPSRSSRSFSRDTDRRGDRFKRDDRRYDDSRYRDDRRSTRGSSQEVKRYSDADSRPQLHPSEGFRDMQSNYNQPTNNAMSVAFPYANQSHQSAKNYSDAYGHPSTDSSAQFSHGERSVPPKPSELLHKATGDDKNLSSVMFPHEQFRSQPFNPTAVSKESSVPTSDNSQAQKSRRRTRFEPEFEQASTEPRFTPESDSISANENQRNQTAYNGGRPHIQNFPESKSTWQRENAELPNNEQWNDKRHSLLNPPSKSTDFVQAVPMDTQPSLSELAPNKEIFQGTGPPAGPPQYGRSNVPPRNEDPRRDHHNRGGLQMHGEVQGSRGASVHGEVQASRGPPMHGEVQAGRGPPMHGEGQDSRRLPIHGELQAGRTLPMHGERQDSRRLPMHGEVQAGRGPPMHGEGQDSRRLPMHGELQAGRGLPMHSEDQDSRRLPMYGEVQGNRGPSIRGEVQDRRQPMHGEVQDRRPPMHGEVQDRRPPVHNEVQERRPPMHSEVQDRGPQMHGEVQGSRGPPIQGEVQGRGPVMHGDVQSRGPQMHGEVQGRGPQMHGEAPNRGSPSLTVEVRGLPPDARIDDVLDLFRGIPLPAANIRIVASNEGFEKAFIRFVSIADFEEALNRNRHFTREGRCELVPCPDAAFDSAPRPQKSKPKPKPREEDLVIQLRGLPFSCKDDDVVSFFDGLGILDLHMVYAADGRASGVGFVEFGTPEDFRAALALNGKTIGHRYVTISVASKEMMALSRGEDVEPASHSRNNINAPPPNKRPFIPTPPNQGPPNPNRPPMNQSRQQPPANIPRLLSPPHCISMKNLPEGVTNRDIAQFLDEVHIIPRAIHIMLRPDKSPSGDAYAEFVNVSDMEAALELNGKNMLDNCVIVKHISFHEMSEILGRPTPIPVPPAPGALLRTPADGDRPRRPLLRQGPNEGSFRERPRMEPPIRGGRPGMDPFSRKDGPPGRPPFGGGRIRGPWPNRSYRPENRFSAPPPERGLKDFGSPGCVVSINNLHFKAGLEELLEFFSGYRISKDNIMRKYNENGQTTGEARVAFENPREAQRAIRELNQKPIMGRSLSLSLL